MKVILIVNFARSGGTLLAKILKTDSRALVFSEINPRAGVTPDSEKAVDPVLAVSEQAREWYDINVTADDLLGAFEQICIEAEAKHKIVTVRDWTYQDFCATKQNEGKLSLEFRMLDLLQTKFDVCALAYVRNAIDVYLSVGGNLEEFALAYCRFARCIVEANLPIIRYEQLLSDPLGFQNELEQITQIDMHLDVQAFQSVPATGDSQLGKRSRGNRANKLVSLPRKRTDHRAAKRIDGCENLRIANKLLGYSGGYWQEKVESQLSYLKRRALNGYYKYWGQ